MWLLSQLSEVDKVKTCTVFSWVYVKKDEQIITFCFIYVATAAQLFFFFGIRVVKVFSNLMHILFHFGGDWCYCIFGLQ